jgi:hypothetical protein
MVKEIAPVTGATNDFNLDFSNEVVKGSLTSTLFIVTINGVNFEAFLEDVNGTIRVSSSTRGAKEVLDFNAGSINYDTGIINLNNFKVDGYFSRARAALGDRVQIFTNSVLPDILVEKDQIIQIQSLNLTVSVTGQTTDD